MTQAEQIAYIRIILGDLSTATLPDATITLFLNRWYTAFNYPADTTKEWYVIYNTCCDCLRWLIAKTNATAGSSATMRREKRGQEEVEVRFADGTTLSQGYQDLLDYIESNPDYIDPSLKRNVNALVIGGVSQEEYSRVKSDPDSLYDTLGINWATKSAYANGTAQEVYPQPYIVDGVSEEFQ